MKKNDKNSRSDSNDLEKNIVCGTLLRRFQQYVEEQYSKVKVINFKLGPENININIYI